MQNIVTICLSSVLLIWFGWTVLYQFQLPITKRGKFLSALSLIPTWRFFAPNPVHTDYEIFFRDRDKFGKTSKFHIVPIRKERTMTQALINPDARTGKVVSDAVRAFTNICKRGKEHTLLESYPYLILRQFIDNLPKENGSVERQFIITRVSDVFLQTPNSEVKVIFTSPFQKN